MLVIGLTGGIGAGKSLVCDRFAQFGVPIIDADTIAKALVQPGLPALDAVVEAFGAQVLSADGGLDRAALRQRIFTDAGARAKLEAILHPRIRQEIERQLQRLNKPYVIVSVPLLLEKNYRGIVHRILVIDVPEAMQIERVCKRDHVTRGIAESMLLSQMQRQERLAQADDIIDNSGDMFSLQIQVERLHKKYESLAQTH